MSFWIGVVTGAMVLAVVLWRVGKGRPPASAWAAESWALEVIKDKRRGHAGMSPLAQVYTEGLERLVEEQEEVIKSLERTNTALRGEAKRVGKRAVEAEERLAEVEGKVRPFIPAVSTRELIEGLVTLGDRWGWRNPNHVALKCALDCIRKLEGSGCSNCSKDPRESAHRKIS